VSVLELNLPPELTKQTEVSGKWRYGLMLWAECLFEKPLFCSLGIGTGV